MIDAVARAFAGDLVILAQYGRQLQLLEVMTSSTCGVPLVVPAGIASRLGLPLMRLSRAGARRNRPPMSSSRGSAAGADRR